MLSCGFEHLPYVRLSRYHSAVRGHWASSRLTPSGFTYESSWRLLREPAAGTHMLYECAVGFHNLISLDPGCEGLEPRGPVGYAYDAQAAGTIPLYRCSIGGGADHFISSSATCEGQSVDGPLGFVHP